MEQRVLGSSGIRVSSLCLGTMNFGAPTDEATAGRMLGRAVDAGVSLIDTAPAYAAGEAERIVGRALKQAGARDRVVLATKVFVRDGAADPATVRQQIVRACDASLERLGTTHVELYQLHRPLFSVPQEEVLRAFDELVGAGKIRFAGCSTHPAWMVMEALSIAERAGLPRYVSEQPPYNLLDRRVENELIPFCLAHDVAVLPWSPLAGGMLAGRYPTADPPQGSRAARVPPYRERLNDRAREVATRFVALAAELSLTPAQLGLLWVRDRPGVTAPVIGPRTAEHLDEALAVAGQQLDEAARERLDELVPPGSAVTDFFANSGWMRMRV